MRCLAGSYLPDLTIVFGRIMVTHSFKANSYNQFFQESSLGIYKREYVSPPLSTVLSLSSTVQLEEHRQEIHNKYTSHIS